MKVVVTLWNVNTAEQIKVVLVDGAECPRVLIEKGVWEVEACVMESE